MDDTTLRTLETRLQYLRNLAQRREEVKASIAAQEKLTDELAKAIDEAATPLRRSRTSTAPTSPSAAHARRLPGKRARAAGGRHLAQTLRMDPPEALAAAYIDSGQGRRDAGRRAGRRVRHPAERISDDAEVRKSLRAHAPPRHGAVGRGKGERRPPSTGSILISRSPSPRLQSHQILALNRGEREGALKSQPDGRPRRGAAVHPPRRGKAREPRDGLLAKAVCDDSYDRLLEPSMERELRTAPD